MCMYSFLISATDQPHIAIPTMFDISLSCWVYINTHGRVSAAKENIQRTSVLITGTAKSPFAALISL